MANGSQHNLYMVKESTYGVTPATPVLTAIRHTGTTLSLTKNTSQSEEIRGDRQITDFRHGTTQVGGDISTEFSYGSFDDLLEAVLMGTWATDTPSVGVDQLKPDTERQSFSVLRHFSDMSAASKPFHLFTGVELNTFSLSVTPDAIVTATFGVIGQGMSTSSTEPTGATYPAASTTKVLDSFTGTLKEGGSTIAVITEVSLSLTNGLEPRFVVGSKETIRPNVGRSNVTGQITAYFEDATLLDKFINETESSIEFSLPDADGNEYTFKLPRVKYNGGQPDVSGEGAVMLSMPFQALYDDTADANLIIERDPA